MPNGSEGMFLSRHMLRTFEHLFLKDFSHLVLYHRRKLQDKGSILNRFKNILDKFIIFFEKYVP